MDFLEDVFFPEEPKELKKKQGKKKTGKRKKAEKAVERSLTPSRGKRVVSATSSVLSSSRTGRRSRASNAEFFGFLGGETELESSSTTSSSTTRQSSLTSNAPAQDEVAANDFLDMRGASPKKTKILGRQVSTAEDPSWLHDFLGVSIPPSTSRTASKHYPESISDPQSGSQGSSSRTHEDEGAADGFADLFGTPPEGTTVRMKGRAIDTLSLAVVENARKTSTVVSEMRRLSDMFDAMSESAPKGQDPQLSPSDDAEFEKKRKAKMEQKKHDVREKMNEALAKQLVDHKKEVLDAEHDHEIQHLKQNVKQTHEGTLQSQKHLALNAAEDTMPFPMELASKAAENGRAINELHEKLTLSKSPLTENVLLALGSDSDEPSLVLELDGSEKEFKNPSRGRSLDGYDSFVDAEQNTAHRARIAKLEKLVKRYRRVIAAKEERIRHLETDNQQLRESIEARAAEVREASALRAREYQDMVQERTTQALSAEQRNDELERQLSDLRKDLQEINHGKRASLIIETLNAKLADEAQDLTTRMNASAGDISTVHHELDRASGSINDAKKQVAENKKLRKQLRDRDNVIANLEALVSQVSDELVRAPNAVSEKDKPLADKDDWETKLREKDGVVTQLKTRFAEEQQLRDEVHRLSQVVKKERATIEQLKHEKKQLRQQHAKERSTLERDVETLKATRRDKDAEMDRLREKSALYKTYLDEMRHSMRDSDNALAREVEQWKDAAREKDAKLERMKGEYDLMWEHREELRHLLQEVDAGQTTETESAKQELLKLQKNFHDVETRCAVLQTEHSILQAESAAADQESHRRQRVLETRIMSLESTESSLIDERTRLVDAVEATERKFQRTKEYAKQKRAEMVERVNSLASLESTYAEATKKHTALSGRYSELEQEMQEATACRQQSSEEWTHMTDEMSRLSAKIEDISRADEEKEHLLTSHLKSHHELMIQSETNMALMALELKEENARANSLAGEEEQLARQIQEKERLAQTWDEERERLNGEVLVVREERFADLQRARLSLQSEISRHSESSDALALQINEYEGEAARLRALLEKHEAAGLAAEEDRRKQETAVQNLHAEVNQQKESMNQQRETLQQEINQRETDLARAHGAEQALRDEWRAHKCAPSPTNVEVGLRQEIDALQRRLLSCERELGDARAEASEVRLLRCSDRERLESALSSASATARHWKSECEARTHSLHTREDTIVTLRSQLEQEQVSKSDLRLKEVRMETRSAQLENLIEEQRRAELTLAQAKQEECTVLENTIGSLRSSLTSVETEYRLDLAAAQKTLVQEKQAWADKLQTQLAVISSTTHATTEELHQKVMEKELALAESRFQSEQIGRTWSVELDEHKRVARNARAEARSYEADVTVSRAAEQAVQARASELHAEVVHLEGTRSTHEADYARESHKLQSEIDQLKMQVARSAQRHSLMSEESAKREEASRTQAEDAVARLQYLEQHATEAREEGRQQEATLRLQLESLQKDMARAKRCGEAASLVSRRREEQLRQQLNDMQGQMLRAHARSEELSRASIVCEENLRSRLQDVRSEVAQLEREHRETACMSVQQEANSRVEVAELRAQATRANCELSEASRLSLEREEQLLAKLEGLREEMSNVEHDNEASLSSCLQQEKALHDTVDVLRAQTAWTKRSRREASRENLAREKRLRAIIENLCARVAKAERSEDEAHEAIRISAEQYEKTRDANEQFGAPIAHLIENIQGGWQVPGPRTPRNDGVLCDQLHQLRAQIALIPYMHQRTDSFKHVHLALCGIVDALEQTLFGKPSRILCSPSLTVRKPGKLNNDTRFGRGHDTAKWSSGAVLEDPHNVVPVDLTWSSGPNTPRVESPPCERGRAQPSPSPVLARSRPSPASSPLSPIALRAAHRPHARDTARAHRLNVEAPQVDAPLLSPPLSGVRSPPLLPSPRQYNLGVTTCSRSVSSADSRKNAEINRLRITVTKQGDAIERAKKVLEQRNAALVMMQGKLDESTTMVHHLIDAMSQVGEHLQVGDANAADAITRLLHTNASFARCDPPLPPRGPRSRPSSDRNARASPHRSASPKATAPHQSPDVRILQPPVVGVRSVDPPPKVLPHRFRRISSHYPSPDGIVENIPAVGEREQSAPTSPRFETGRPEANLVAPSLVPAAKGRPHKTHVVKELVTPLPSFNNYVAELTLPSTTFPPSTPYKYRLNTAREVHERQETVAHSTPFSAGVTSLPDRPRKTSPETRSSSHNHSQHLCASSPRATSVPTQCLSVHGYTCHSPMLPTYSTPTSGAATQSHVDPPIVSLHVPPTVISNSTQKPQSAACSDARRASHAQNDTAFDTPVMQSRRALRKSFLQVPERRAQNRGIRTKRSVQRSKRRRSLDALYSGFSGEARNSSKPRGVSKGAGRRFSRRVAELSNRSEMDGSGNSSVCNSTSVPKRSSRSGVSINPSDRNRLGQSSRPSHQSDARGSRNLLHTKGTNRSSGSMRQKHAAGITSRCIKKNQAVNLSNPRRAEHSMDSSSRSVKDSASYYSHRSGVSQSSLSRQSGISRSASPSSPRRVDQLMTPSIRSGKSYSTASSVQEQMSKSTDRSDMDRSPNSSYRSAARSSTGPPLSNSAEQSSERSSPQTARSGVNSTTTSSRLSNVCESTDLSRRSGVGGPAAYQASRDRMG